MLGVGLSRFLCEGSILAMAVLSRFKTRYQTNSDAFTQDWEKTLIKWVISVKRHLERTVQVLSLQWVHCCTMLWLSRPADQRVVSISV